MNKYGADFSLLELNMLIGMEPWTLHHGTEARMCTVFIGMTDLGAKHVAAMDGYPEAVVIDLKSTDVEQTTDETPWPFIMAASRFWEQVSLWQSKTWTCRESTCIEGFWLLKLQPIREIAHIDKLVLGILVAGPALDVKKHGEWMASAIRGYKAILLVVLGAPHDSSGGSATEQEASTAVYHPMVRKIFESECFQDWAVRCHEVGGARVYSFGECQTDNPRMRSGTNPRMRSGDAQYEHGDDNPRMRSGKWFTPSKVKTTRYNHCTLIRMSWQHRRSRDQHAARRWRASFFGWKPPKKVAAPRDA